MTSKHPTYLYIPADVLQAPISAEAKLVCAAIRFLATPTGTCDVPYREIGAIVGMGKRAVMRVVQALIKARFVIDRGGKNGSIKRLAVHGGLGANMEQPILDTGTESEAVQNLNRCEIGTGPVPKTYRFGTKSVSVYKEEITNNNNPHSAPKGPGEPKSGPAIPSAGKARTPPGINPAFQALFDLEVWPLWPRKVARKGACTTLARLYEKRGVEFVRETIIPAIRVQKMAGGRLNPSGGAQFIPHLATWLNGEEWHNEGCAISSEEPIGVWLPPWDKDPPNG